MYKACQPAFKRASENAKKMGMPYGMVLLTTPNQKDVAAGAFAYSVYESAARWTVECFDFTDEELDNFVLNNSQTDFILIEYSYKELGRSEEWLKEQVRQMIGDLAKVKREILLEWPRSMDTSVFTEDDLEKISQFVRNPKSHLFTMNKSFCIDLYDDIDIMRNYIISCDVAGGLSSDYSAISLIDPEDFRIVGDFRNNKISTDDFKELIRELMTVFFRNALLVIEKNSFGLVIIDNLMKDPLVEPRMYREDKEKKGEKTQSNGFVIRKKTKSTVYGVDTNTVTRKQMFDLLPEIVETEYDKLISPKIYSDIAGLEKKRNGKIEHASGGHDDNLMSYLIFRWAVFYGKCFKDRFGINPVPSRMNVRSSDNSFTGQMDERLTQILNAAIVAETTSNINLYDEIVAQTQRLNSTEEKTESRRIADAFMRVSALNSTNDYDDYGGF